MSTPKPYVIHWKTGKKPTIVPIKRENDHYRPVGFYLQKNTVKVSQTIPYYLQDNMEMSNRWTFKKNLQIDLSYFCNMVASLVSMGKKENILFILAAV